MIRQGYAPWHGGCTTEGVLVFAFGILVGVVLGTIVIGFLAISAYDHGYEEALERRGERMAELRARHSALARRLRERARAS